MDDLLSRISIVLERQDFRMCVPPQSDDTDIVLGECRNAIESLRQQLAAALAACEVKQAALQEIIDLMSESYGLTGFHLNGDVAPWSELEEGGRFERLTSLNNAVTIQPDASALKAHDEALIERCIKAINNTEVLIDGNHGYTALRVQDDCAAAIRELKTKKNT